MSVKLKKRPNGILDAYKSTMHSRAVKEDFFREDTVRKLIDDRALKETIQKVIKTEKNFVGYRLEEESNEKSLVVAKQREREEFDERQQRMKLTNRRIVEKEKEKLAEESLQKRKLQILMNSTNYHDFQRQIQMAQIAKEQLEQIKLKQIDRTQDKEKEIEERRHLEEELKKLDDTERNKKVTIQLRKQEYQNVLLNQMEDRREMKRYERVEEKNREKKLLDEMRNKEQIDTQRDHQRILEKKNEARRIYEDYLMSHNQRMERERQKAALEMQRLQEYHRRQQEREQRNEERTNTSRQRREDLIDKVSRIMTEENRRRIQKENERIGRQEKEIYEKQRAEQQKEYRSEKAKKEEARSSVLNQLKRREQQLYRELAEEQRFGQKEEEEGERNLQTKIQHRQKNGKQLEYLEELQKMMEELKEQRNRDEKTEAEFFRRKAESERKVDDCIEREKQSLLKNQLTDLWGHLPKSILKTTAARSARSQI